MAVDLLPCDHAGCVDGRVTRCDFIDAKGWPRGERSEKCTRCAGRGYFLPEPGVYSVEVEGFDEATVCVVVSEKPWNRAVFTGSDWDLSEDCKVKWKHLLVPKEST